MTYIRIKKIKGKEYAYLVQSKWKRLKGRKDKTSKQKIKAYLGRVCRLEKERNLDFWETVETDPEDYLRLASKDKILDDLIRFELLKHGFMNQSLKGSEDLKDYRKSKRKWLKDGIIVDINKKNIINKSNSKCVLAINEGFLCNYRLKKLYKYEDKGEIKEIGLELARLFIDSGIDIPQDVFIGFYEKL